MSPNQRDPDGDDLLQRAAGPDGSLAHVKLLVESGARVDLRDEIGGTALQTAINSMNPDIARYLIEKGAPVNTSLSNGTSVAWSVQFIIDRQNPGPVRSAYEELRDLMIQRGVVFPPEAPSDRKGKSPSRSK